VTAPKANLGEALDPSGLLQCIAALHALSERVAPPIPRLQHPALLGLRYASVETALPDGAALLTATSNSGACSSLIVSTEAE
jgi:3-oxoacyl-(acyl-carrier-protein) synthase